MNDICVYKKCQMEAKYLVCTDFDYRDGLLMSEVALHLCYKHMLVRLQQARSLGYEFKVANLIPKTACDRCITIALGKLKLDCDNCRFGPKVKVQFI